jgi:hypothetical protein
LRQHVILSEEQLVYYRYFFSTFDAGASGRLSVPQVHACLREMSEGEIQKEVLDYVLLLLEANADLASAEGCSAARTATWEHEGLSFDQFAVVAALSRRVCALNSTGRAGLMDLHPGHLRQMVRKVRDLFLLNSCDSEGAVTLDDLIITLQAGRLGDRELASFRGAFGDESAVKFFDFLVFMPLFTNIHRDILDNTLAEEPRGLTSATDPAVRASVSHDQGMLCRAASRLQGRLNQPRRGITKVRASRKGTLINLQKSLTLG